MLSQKFLISDLIKEIARDWQRLSISIPNGACEIFTCPPGFSYIRSKVRRMQVGTAEEYIPQLYR